MVAITGWLGAAVWAAAASAAKSRRMGDAIFMDELTPNARKNLPNLCKRVRVNRRNVDSDTRQIAGIPVRAKSIILI
jgi:glycogen debranching enzyme